MKMSAEQVEFVNNNGWLILSTCLNAMPRSSIVLPARIESERILLLDIEMKTTLKNIESNPNVSVLSYNQDMSRWMKIRGKAFYETSGALMKELTAVGEMRGMVVKGVVIISITDIEDVRV